MNKLTVVELGKEYVDNGICELKFACPSHTKDTVKIQGGDSWITVEFLETDVMLPRKFNYETEVPVKAINCKFDNGILICKIQLELPKQRKLNVTFD